MSTYGKTLVALNLIAALINALAILVDIQDANWGLLPLNIAALLVSGFFAWRIWDIETN